MNRSQTLLTSNQGAAAASAANPAHFPVWLPIWFPGILLSATLLLSACAQPGGKMISANAAAKTPKTVAHGVMNAPTPAAKPEAADPAAAATPAPATIWHNADKLLGLAPEELQAALGKPARIRDEDSSRIYQYVGSDCVLDLFLYLGAEGRYRVSYTEARSIHAEKKPVDACLKSLPAPIVADNSQPGS